MAESLRSQQARFADGLLDGGLDPCELFRGDQALAARRFALYRGNIAANWTRALSNAYPVLEALVGEQFFHALAREFGRRNEFREGDLNRFGAPLADFIDDFGPLREHRYMGDVARLEWAVHSAHFAADAPALERAIVTRLDTETLTSMSLALRPGTALLRSDWAIGAIWLAHQSVPCAALPNDPARPSRIVVHRPAWKVQVRELDSGEFAALSALCDGAALGSALESALDAQPDFDPAQALTRWLADRLFLPPQQ